MANSKTHEEIKADIAAERATLINVGRELIAHGEEPFAIDIPDKELVPLTLQVSQTRETSDVHLAFLLHTQFTKDLHLAAGYPKFVEYAEKELFCTSGKTLSLLKAWDAFLDTGLPVSIFGGSRPVSWAKFKELVPAINKGVITAETIVEWLPRIAVSGSHALYANDIRNKVKMLMAKDEEAKEPDSTVKVTLQMEATERVNFLEYARILGEVTNEESGSQVVLNALAYQVAQVADSSDQAASMLGVAGLKRMIETLIPGTEVMLVGKPEEHAALDVPIVKAYIGSVDDGKPIVALANDPESVKDLLPHVTFEEATLLNNSPSSEPKAAKTKLETKAKKEVAEVPRPVEIESIRDTELVETSVEIDDQVVLSDEARSHYETYPDSVDSVDEAELGDLLKNLSERLVADRVMTAEARDALVTQIAQDPNLSLVEKRKSLMTAFLGVVKDVLV